VNYAIPEGYLVEDVKTIFIHTDNSFDKAKLNELLEDGYKCLKIVDGINDVEGRGSFEQRKRFPDFFFAYHMVKFKPSEAEKERQLSQEMMHSTECECGRCKEAPESSLSELGDLKDREEIKKFFIKTGCSINFDDDLYMAINGHYKDSVQVSNDRLYREAVSFLKKGVLKRIDLCCKKCYRVVKTIGENSKDCGKVCVYPNGDYSCEACYRPLFDEDCEEKECAETT